MNKTDISWCEYTWNPVTGCKRGCSYCYAKKIHDRFNKTLFSDIVFHPERLEDPAKVKKPSTVFVGSMSGCEYWSPEHWEKVLLTCNKYPWHKYMFLTKDLAAYEWASQFCGFPANTMQGLTIESPGSYVTHQWFSRHITYPRPYLSIEPISGGLYSELPNRIELVIVGAETGNRKYKIIPQKVWIQSIVDHAPADKIHWKPSMTPYLQEYGIEVKHGD